MYKWQLREQAVTLFNDTIANFNLPHYRLIFINLVTVSILLGIFPHPHLLTMFGLSEQFLPLIQAIKLGDRSAFRFHLDTNMEWFRKRYIYLILRAKGEVLVIRNLFRRACVPFNISSGTTDVTKSRRSYSVLLSRILWPPDKDNQPPTIQFEHLLTAVRFSYRYSAIGDMNLSTWDRVDMEALCASLIDQVIILIICA